MQFPTKRLQTMLTMTSLLANLGVAAAQSAAVVTNIESANWTADKSGHPDTASVLLHEDKVTGGIDLLVRYPAGHVIAPHFHDSNERIFVAEGQLTLHQESGEKQIDPGGFAYHLTWDGKPDSHKAK